MGFNPAEAEEWFRSWQNSIISLFLKVVSIQPKPKNGLEAQMIAMPIEEFREVSIQPKPKNGLEVYISETPEGCPMQGFNPAEAEEWFRSNVDTANNRFFIVFQSSRSRRMV